MIFPSVIIVKAMIIFYLQLNVDPNSKNVQCLHTCLSYINNGILQTLTFAHNTQCDIPKNDYMSKQIQNKFESCQ